MTGGARAGGRHILHVIDSLDPAAGGPTEVVRSLFEFAPSGYTGEVVTLDDPGAGFLQSYRFPVHALGRGSKGIGYSRSLDRWLREHRERFDGAMVHGLWRYVSFATWRALRGRKPYVVFPHGMLDPYFKRRFPWKHRLKWVYWRLGEYRVLRDAERVLFTTEEESRLAEQSFRLHPWTGTVVPLGATRPEKSEHELIAAFLAAFPALRDVRFVLFLGRIHPKKGCDLLVSAFVREAAKDPDLHLVMAGPDQQDWSAGLKDVVSAAGLSERVHWPGMLRGEVKWGAFHAAEAFVLPSHQENFGIAVAEALACGRPVLLSDKVNVALEIERAGAGLVETDTLEGTVRLLERWMSMGRESRLEMGVRARALFEQRYNMRENAERILRIFDQAGGG